MNYAERIREARPRLSKSFIRLADYILDSYIQSALMTTSELAHQVNVDAATVVRFAQALNYSGFPEMQDEIKERVLEELHLEPKVKKVNESLADVVDLRLQEISQSLDRTRRLLDIDVFEKLGIEIKDSKKILIIAKNSLRAVGSYFSQELGKFGILAKFTALEEDNLANEIAATGQGDFVLVIDMDGKSKLLGAAVAQAKSFGLSTGTIVAGASYEAARQAEIVLEINIREKGESEFLLLAAILESLLELMRKLTEKDHAAYEARVKKARRNFAKLN